MNLEKKRQKLYQKRYVELDTSEKRILYAYEIWADGGDKKIVSEILKRKDLTAEDIDRQLRGTFEYLDTTILL